MSRRLRTILTQVGSFALAGLLLFLALRGLDLDEIGAALSDANYLWLIPLVLVVLASHWLRAWRWVMLIEALPPDERPVRRVTTAEAFGAVLIGYMVNYVAPRLGEVVRTANLATRQKIGFSSLFGTVVVERILDVVVLLLGLLSVVVLLRHRIEDLYLVFVEPLRLELGLVPMLLVGLGTLALFAAIFFISRSYLRASTRASAIWKRRIRPLASSFKAGLLTIVRSRRRTGLIVSTLAIWSCYALAAHMPFYLLNMVEPYQISLVDSWSIMLLGAVGVALPSPGGTGTFHFITILVLTTFFDVARAPAAAYAVLTHGAQLVLYALSGFVALLAQGSSVRTLARRTAAAQESADGVERAADSSSSSTRRAP
ncbi:MAG TPA: lysylphosphatidylglycerol synthase transmembrane domain-containing protein [Rhodothermales bacterium]